MSTNRTTEKKAGRDSGDKPMINEEVSAEEVAEVVSKWTGIPVSRMLSE
jgi:ATP-dependent Clp protease ATP-binding subunit ClpB